MPLKASMYLQEGGVKLTVVDEVAKEPVVAILGSGDFFGEGCRVGHSVRLGTATEITPSTVQGSSLSPLALYQNSKAVHGPDKLTHRNPIQPADPCSKTSNRRKESINSPTKSCHCFCVMDAPEIHQSPGFVVVGEFLTTIQASDVGYSTMDSSVSG